MALAPSTTVTPAGQPLVGAAPEEYARERHLAWKKFARHRLALAGAVVLVGIILTAIFAPLLSHWDPNAIDNNWAGSPLVPGTCTHMNESMAWLPVSVVVGMPAPRPGGLHRFSIPCRPG